MYHVPSPPKTLVTRQIMCICCHEKFTVSVDVPRRSGRNRHSSHWHVPTDRFITTMMRFTQRQHHRPVVPQTLAQPIDDPEEDVYRNPNVHYHVNCPRCGADNRNWLNAQISRFPLNKAQWIGAFLVLFVFLLAFAFIFKIGEKRSLYLALSILLAGWLPLVIIPKLWPSVRIHNHLSEVAPATRGKIPPHWWPAVAILFVFAFVLPFIRYVVFPGTEWFYKSLQPEPGLVDRIDGLSANREFRQLEKLYESQNQPVINAYASLANQINGQTPNCQLENIDEQLALLETAKTENPDFYTHALNRIRLGLSELPIACQKVVLGEVLSILIANGQNGVAGGKPVALPCTGEDCANNNVVVDAIRELERLIGELPNEESITGVSALSEDGRKEILQKTRQTAINIDSTSATAIKISNNLDTFENALTAVQPAPPIIDNGFLVAWFVVVFLAWLIGTIAANMAMNMHINLMDPHLPRPIFTNITDMTRLAIWELRRTLEVEAYLHQIQWMEANRNETGGIKLVGLHRGLPEFTAFGTRKGDKVSAQKYTITTNPWVKISQAEIKDVEVPHTITTPAFVASVETWPGESPVRPNGGSHGGGNGRSGGNGGIVLNDGPMDTFPSSGRQPDATQPEPMMDTAVLTQETVTPPMPQTPGQPPAAYIPAPLYYPATAEDIDLATYSHAGELTLAQVSQLSRNICNHFNVSELRNLCFDLNVDYDVFPGRDKREKANEIIRYFGRRGLILDLLNVLQIKRPHFTWDIVN